VRKEAMSAKSTTTIGGITWYFLGFQFKQKSSFVKSAIRKAILISV
jgi:hypothetical protein